MIAIQEVATATTTTTEMNIKAALAVAAEQKKKAEEANAWAMQQAVDAMRKDIPAWLVPCIGEIHMSPLGDVTMQIDTPQGTIRLTGCTIRRTLRQWDAWLSRGKRWMGAATWEQALALAVEHGGEPMGADNPF